MNIICFGKNYADHMHELGDQPVDKPVIFLKPTSVLRVCENWHDTLSLYFPTDAEIHYECELVFRLKAGGFQLTLIEAQNALDAYTIGLDLTKRDLQKKLKEAGHPWTIGKAFPDAAVIGPWIPLDDMNTCFNQPFSFSLNQQVQQTSFGKNMLFSPTELVVYASYYFPLSAGDILFTGTPSGVGKIAQGDRASVTVGERTYHAKWE